MEPEVKVYEDPSGQYADIYTVIIGEYCYSMSNDPLWPLGINQYCCLAEELSPDFFETQKEVAFEDLPDEVQKAIQLRMNGGFE